MAPLAAGARAPSAQQLAGGPATGSPIIYAVLAVFAVVLALEIFGATDLPLWWGLGALGASLCILVAAWSALPRTLLRALDEHPIPVWASALVGAALGAVTAAPFALALWAWGAAFSAPTPGLLMSMPIRTAFLFPALAYLMGLRWWYAGEREQAEQALVRAEAQRVRAGDAVTTTRTLLIDAARRDIGPSHREAAELLEAAAASESADDWSRAADSLRSTARSAVRSASHELWVDSGDRAARIRWRSIVPAALVRHPLPLGIPLLMTAGFVLVRSEAARLGLLAPIAAVAACAAALGVTYGAGQRIIRWRPGWAIPVTIIAAWIAALAAQAGVLVITDRTPALVNLIGGPLALLLATVSVSLVLMVRDSGAAAIQAMVDDRARADAQRAALDDLNAELSRELASHLHSTVQPSLMAASVALDKAVRSGDAQSLRSAALLADDALRMGVDMPAAAPGRTLHEVVRSLHARWRAMLDIDIQVHPGGAGARPGDEIAPVLDECLNNAVVHGMATCAVIRIACEGDECTVQVTDDGVGPCGGDPGLGAALLAGVTGGDWSLAPGPDGGAVATARIRMPDAPGATA